ncbi:MAG: hypothetical protein J2P16_12260, partial [Mycobacterium sp.]|nr:hypothetical protein [Mycobacterium sp.]
LVLAIGASAALVFTNRAELLKLAVILALWAAVVAAFVSVIYRRQSDADQARVRDLKLVYDLQLDREISARREYELTVESQLRRELASELRAHAADEVAALRAELAALRSNLEILFDAELGQRPALESERGSVRGYSDWERDNESPRDRINRVSSVRAEDTTGSTDDTSIIDVPEEPLVPPQRPDGYTYQAAERFRGAEAYEAAQAYPGSQWQQNDNASRLLQDQPSSWAPPEPQYEPEPPPPSKDQRPTWATPDVGGPPASGDQPQHPAPATDWQPADGQWLPRRTPGNNWTPGPADNNAVTGESATTGSEPRLAAPSPVEQRGRHSVSAESVSGRPVEDESGGRYGDAAEGAGHSTESGAEPSASEPVMAPPPEPAARHRSPDRSSDPDAPASVGQSVADLLARLQASPGGGGRRRHREE